MGAVEGAENHRVSTERNLIGVDRKVEVLIECTHLDHSGMFLWRGPAQSQHIGWRQLVAHMKWEG